MFNIIIEAKTLKSDISYTKDKKGILLDMKLWLADKKYDEKDKFAFFHVTPKFVKQLREILGSISDESTPDEFNAAFDACRIAMHGLTTHSDSDVCELIHNINNHLNAVQPGLSTEMKPKDDFNFDL
jgi:hypothetical protein